MQLQPFLDLMLRSAKVTIVTHRRFHHRSFLHKNHVHDALYQVCYLVKGISRPLVDGRALRLEAGDAIVLAPGQWHGPGPEAHTEETELWQLKFILPGRKRWQPRGVIHMDARLEVESVFQAMFSELHMRRPLREQVLRGHLLQLALILHRSLLQQERGGRRPRAGDRLPVRDERKVRQAMDWIAQHYAGPVALPALASSVGMSVSALSRAFKTLAGVSPMRYLADLRLSQAVALMRQTDDKLETIAEAVGFASANYLSRVFRKRFRQTPRRYATRHSG